tara:strand:- start:339 stop:1397 length:1059 start_codon:yes stop_codon:yes gene_type:complete
MSTAGWRFLDVGKGLAYATSMVRPLLIAFCLGTLASLASQGHAAPANRTAMKAKKAKAKKAKIPRREGRPTRKVERALHPVKPPKTEVQRYRLGEGPAKTVIFLHGLGGEPGGPMMRGVLKGMQNHGVSAHVFAPLLREVRRNDQGEIVSQSRQSMTEQLRHARGVIEAQPGKVILFGHSFGAKAALILAKEYPNKVEAIVAVAPSVKMLHAYWKSLSGESGLAEPARMQAVFATRQTDLKTRIANTHDPVLKENLAESLNYHKIMRDLIGHQEAQFETGVKVPTMVFHGDMDQAVSKHYVRRFAEDNHNVKLVTYPKHDHSLMGPSAKTTRDVRLDVGRRTAEFLSGLRQD